MNVFQTLRHVVVGVSLTMLAGTAGAQASAGRAFHPRANPANPNLIAFERLEGDRREIQFQLAESGKLSSLKRAAAPANANVISLPGLSGEERVTSYSGDLDWRPVSEGGRYWFAYVASEQNRLSLFVQSIDRNGEVAASEPLRVPNGVGARSPRWSPDGRHLSFVSDDGALMIVPDVASALSTANATRMRPARVATGRGAVLFPEWSPVGNYIAYQVSRQEGGSARFGLEIIQVDPRSGVVSTAPMAVAESNDDDNKFRPSWSPRDGRYLAFYVDRPGSGRADEQLLDIGVVELQTDPNSKRIFRSEAKAGRSRRIADGVIPSATRGPMWTRVAGANGPELSIVYVQKDEARNNPVIVASVESWIAMRARAEYSAQLSGPWGTANHKDISATDMRGQTRYTYVAVEGGGERVKLQDVNAPWATGAVTVLASAPTQPNPNPVAVTGGATTPRPTANTSVVATQKRAPGIFIMVPGLTQMYEGRTGVGTLLFLPAMAGGFAGAYMVAECLDLLRETSCSDTKKNIALASAVVVGIPWIIGIIESSKHRSSLRAVSVDMAPSGKPDGSMVTRVGLRLSLPGNNR